MKSVDSLRSADDALAELDRAENELAMLFPSAAGGYPQQPTFAQPPEAQPSDPAPGRPSPAATQTAPPPPSKPKKEALSAELAAADRDDQTSSCALACRALGSMQRATERLCELAGEASLRCDSAKQRVETAIARVQPVCSDCAS